MSSFSRRTFVLSGLALVGCGFTPAYGPASALRGTVRLGAPDSANAFDLVRALEFRLGVAETPRFDLRVAVDLDEEGSVITRTSEIDRFSIEARAEYELVTLDGVTVTTGRARAFASYSASSTPMATRAARDDAQLRLMEMLADDIVAALAAAFE